jgi:hypothetical protein
MSYLGSPARRATVRLLILAAPLSWWRSAPAQSAPSAAAAPGRPVVLMLHGLGAEDQDSTGLRREWLDALNQGIVGVTRQAPFGAEDFRLVWYADALDPRAPQRCPKGREAAPSGEVGSLLATVGELMGVVADVTGDAEGAALRSLAGDLLYLGDARKRCAAEERLADALSRASREARPVILVAHSFGSLVAYHYFESRDTAGAVPVERLVTVGSLVGRPEMRELLLGSAGRSVRLPPGIGSWVNVRDPADELAAPISGERADSPAPAGILDRRTERPPLADPHDATRYLLDPATARAVLEAWCRAFPAGRSGGPACEA